MKRLQVVIFVSLIFSVLFIPAGLVAQESDQLSEIRKNAEALMREQSKAYWKTWVLGEPSNLAALYDNYPDLFTKNSIDLVKKGIAYETDKQQKKALIFLLHYMEAEYLYKQTALLWDIYNDLEANLKVLLEPFSKIIS